MYSGLLLMENLAWESVGTESILKPQSTLWRTVAGVSSCRQSPSLRRRCASGLQPYLARCSCSLPLPVL